MKARPFYWVIAAAFVVWLAIVALGRGAEDPPPTTTTTTDTGPDEVAALQGQLDETTRKLAYVSRKRIAERRGFRRRLAYVIHSPSYAGHWLEKSFGCIHVGEGSWTDPNAPYYGGLQMDYGFQRTYAPWALHAFGTANNWPVSVQVATAIRAYVSGRGFYPWPNTARACGLLR